MHFQIEQRFAAPLEPVEAALIDARFLSRLAGLPKLGQPDLLDQQANGDIVTQRVRYRFAGDLSGAVRAVVDPTRLSWVEVSKIDLAHHATTFEIVPDHYSNMLKCRGSFHLRTATPSGCVRVGEGDMEVHVPLVGRRVEAAIVSGLREHAAAEASVMDEWLAEKGNASTTEDS